MDKDRAERIAKVARDSLCWYDPRYSNYLGGDGEPRQPGCACDNCFYGRDLMARDLLALLESLEDSQQVWTRNIFVGDPPAGYGNWFEWAKSSIKTGAMIRAIRDGEWPTTDETMQ